MTRGEILSAEEIADLGVWWAPGDGIDKAGAVIDSHEALRARLAEVEAERVEWHQAYESADDRAKVAVMRAEASEARLAEVEQALRPFAEYAEGLDDALPDSVAVAARSHTGPGFDRHEQVSFGDFRRARAVLDKGEQG